MRRKDRLKLTDAHIRNFPLQGQDRIFGRTDLSAACYTWHDVLAMVAADLTRRGEDAAVRARLKARVTSVRAFLRERYGIFTGPREYFHDSWLTPDRADLRDFLRACQRARVAGNRKHTA